MLTSSLVSGCHLKHRQGTPEPPRRLPRTSIRDRGCQSKFKLNPRQHWWMNQHTPENFTDTVKRGNLFSPVITTNLKNALSVVSPRLLYAAVITSNGPWLWWQGKPADSGQGADTKGAEECRSKVETNPGPRVRQRECNSSNYTCNTLINYDWSAVYTWWAVIGCDVR